MNNYFLMADLVILFPSLKAVLTCLAIVCIVWGQFEADRIHDEASGSSGTQPPPPSSLADHFSDVYTTLSGGSNTTGSIMPLAALDSDVVEARKLQALWKGPAGRPLRVALAGWILLLACVFLDAGSYAGLSASWYSVGHVLVLLLLMVTQSLVLPLQVVDQAVHEHSVFLGCATALGSIGWAILLTLEEGISIFWTLACAVCVTASWYAFWHKRKRGDSYDRCSVENIAQASTYSWGGPLLAMGWCGFWLSFNAVRAIPKWYIGIYWTSRAQCALLGVFLVTVGQWAIDYAHDEYKVSEASTTVNPDSNLEKQENEVGNNNNNNRNKLFLLNGILEIRIVHYASWFVLASTAFLPFYIARLYWAAALFGAILLQGYATSQQHILGLRAGSEVAYEKRQRATWCIYLLIVTFTAFHSGVWACILSAVGIVVQQCGKWFLHRDRKRGVHWMATQMVNDQNFKVYSYGTLLVPTGMLIWAWGLSMP